MMVDDIAAYLAAGGHGTVGKDIFREKMPETPVLCTVLYAYSGNAPELLGDVEYPMLQVKTRGESREDAMERINEVLTMLHTLGETTMSGTRYLYIKAVSSMAFAGYDRQTGGAPVYVINFLVAKEIE